VVNSTHQLFFTQLSEKKINLSKQIPPGDLTVYVDPDRIAQVLFNLIDNAYEHTPTRGDICITVGQIQVEGGVIRAGKDQQTAFPAGTELPSPGVPLEDGPWVLLAIRDTGMGISANDLPHVFERFYRADTSRARQRGGSGLGLPIARTLVEAHGGHIWLESPANSPPLSQSPGTTAFVALPLLN
jgi:signal transduction histidine kinase